MSRITPAGSPASRTAGEQESVSPGTPPADGQVLPPPPAPSSLPTTSPLPADGRSTRWEDHRAARRVELVHAARRAVHRQGPDVSMDEIATAGGTSKSIVYRYFVDKTGLQLAVGEAVISQMHAALDAAAQAATTPREGLRSMIDVYLEMVEASPNVYWFVTRPVADDASGPLGPFLEQVAALIARPFARVLTAGTPAPDLADVWAAGAVGFIRGAGEWWLKHRSDPAAPPREELTERVTAWLWAGPVSVLARARTDVGQVDEGVDLPPGTTTPPVLDASRGAGTGTDQRTSHHLTDEEHR